MRAFTDFFETFAGDGLQPGSLSVLILIGENPGIRQGVLAQTLMIKRSHMAKIVQGFGEKGLVARRVPADDRRSVELRLTDKGESLVASTMPKFLAHEAASADSLTAEERQTLLALLTKFHGAKGPAR
nr:MarR family winged helix-turn-helix transcriptional regulator [Jiella sp. LLJ827]